MAPFSYTAAGLFRAAMAVTGNASKAYSGEPIPHLLILTRLTKPSAPARHTQSRGNLSTDSEKIIVKGDITFFPGITFTWGKADQFIIIVFL